MHHYNIKPKKGLGDVKFLSTVDEFISMIGQPDDDELIQEKISNYNSRILHYDSLELSASFDEENNWKLSRAVCYHQQGLLPRCRRLQQLRRRRAALRTERLERARKRAHAGRAHAGDQVRARADGHGRGGRHGSGGGRDAAAQRPHVAMSGGRPAHVAAPSERAKLAAPACAASRALDRRPR